MEHKTGIAALTTPISLAQLVEAWIGEFCPACGRGGHKTNETAAATPSSSSSSSVSSWSKPIERNMVINKHKRPHYSTRNLEPDNNDVITTGSNRYKITNAPQLNPPALPKRTVLASSVTISQDEPLPPLKIHTNTNAQSANEQKLRAFLSHPASQQPAPQSLITQYQNNRRVTNNHNNNNSLKYAKNNHAQKQQQQQNNNDDEDEDDDVAPAVDSDDAQQEIREDDEAEDN